MMGKIQVSPEVGQKLRMYRLKSGIRAKDVAQYIGKTPAYITKLERGDFKSVDKESLDRIVSYITGDSNGCERFIDDYLLSSSSDEVNAQLELMQFDMIERVIPVPESLTDYINEQIKELGISIEELVDYINKNDDYDDETLAQYNLSRTSIRYNTMYPIQDDDSPDKIKRTIILYHFSEASIIEVLSRRTTVCPHAMLFAIVYNILKLKKGRTLPEAERWRLKSETSKILTEHKFYTILDRSRFSSVSGSPSEYKSFLNAYDLENFQLVNDIFERFEFLSNVDVTYANEKMKVILQNLTEDPSFALSFMALPLHTLSNLTVTQKKRFLELVANAIVDTASTATSNYMIELY